MALRKVNVQSVRSPCPRLAVSVSNGKARIVRADSSSGMSMSISNPNRNIFTNSIILSPKTFHQRWFAPKSLSRNIWSWNKSKRDPIEDEKEVLDLLKQANDKRKAKKYDEVFAITQKVLDMDSNYLEKAYGMRGLCFLEQDNVDAALESFQKALRIDPSVAVNHYYRGCCLVKKQKYSEALDAFDSCIQMDSEFEPAVHNKGVTLAMLNKHTEAIKQFDLAIQLEPEDMKPYFEKGNSLIKLRQFRASLDFFDEAIRLEPDFDGAYQSKGFALSQLQEYEKALQCYDKSLELAPQDTVTMTQKGVVLRELGKLEESLDTLDQALKLKQYDLEIMIEKGATLSAMNKYQEVVDHFSQLLESAPKSVIAMHLKALALANLGKNDEALALIEQGLAISPSSSQLWYGKGIVLKAMDKDREAIESFNKAASRGPYPDAVREKGLTHMKLKEYAQAMEAFDVVLEENQFDMVAIFKYAESLRHLGRFKDAVHWYKRLTALIPEDKTVFYLQGVCHAHIGEHERAMECLDQAMKQEKKFPEIHYLRGLLQIAMEKWDDAVQSFTNSIENGHNVCKSWIMRGRSHLGQGNKEECAKCYENAIKFNREEAISCLEVVNNMFHRKEKGTPLDLSQFMKKPKNNL